MEHWGWFDSFYMVVITLSTIGYQEVHSAFPWQAGSLNTALIIAGVCAGFFDDRVADPGFARIRNWLKSLGNAGWNAKSPNWKDHYIICGAGRVGNSVARELRESLVLL